MYCPNCRQTLIALEENERIYKCEFCGGVFFEENEINRISPVLLNEIARHSYEDRELIQTKICPKDNLPMSRMAALSIPSFVSLYKCPKCSGIFTSAHDLKSFKDAQKAKITFYKTWQTPLPSLSAVLVFSIALVVTFVGFKTLHYYNTNLPTTHAESVVKNINLKKTSDGVLLYFTTEKAYKSSVTFYRVEDNAPISVQNINSAPSQVHLVKITSPAPSQQLYLKITLQSASDTIPSDQIPFIVK